MLLRLSGYIGNAISLAIEHRGKSIVILTCAEILTGCTGVIAIGSTIAASGAWLVANSKKITLMEEENKKLKTEMIELKTRKNEAEEKINSLNKILQNNTKTIEQQQKDIIELQNAKIRQQSTRQVSRIHHKANEGNISYLPESFFGNPSSLKPDYRRAEVRTEAQKISEQDNPETKTTCLNLL
jgi:TolA-binding protein